jgi:hypothetical protein
MEARHREALADSAALLERAYRLALVLQDRLGQGDVESHGAQAQWFEGATLSSELVALLDEARVRLLAHATQSAMPSGTHR